MQREVDPSKYLSAWRWVEVGIGRGKGIARLQDQQGDPIYHQYDDLASFRATHHNRGLYHSVWLYDKPMINSMLWGPLYFDLDAKDDIELAYKETQIIIDHLHGVNIPNNAIKVFFSGNKGFHIEIEPLALGITPNNNLHKQFRYIANHIKTIRDLTTIDFAVYDARRMWRLTNSQHEKSGLYKVELGDKFYYGMSAILEYAKQPQEMLVQTNVTFDLQANIWFKELLYKQEEEQQYSLENQIKKFESNGSWKNIDLTNTELEFDAKEAFGGCCQILRDIWSKAESEHDLTHTERLIACSLLTYNDEAIKYLYAILSLCSDFSYDKSEAHINDWLARRAKGIAGRPYTCQRIKEEGLYCEGCPQLEVHTKKIAIGSKLIEIDNTYADPSPVRLLYNRTKKH